MIDEKEFNQEESNDKEELYKPNQPKVNFESNRPYEKASDVKKPVLSLLRENMKTVQDILEANGDLLNRMDNGEFNNQDDDALWIQTIAGGLANAALDETPIMATEREGSNWTQALEHEGKHIRPGKPLVKHDPSRKQTDDEVLSYLSKKSNRGGPEDFPMVHSGVWVRLRTPLNSEVVVYQQRLANTKERLGRTTKGSAFSNLGGILLNETTDFALSLLQATNVKYSTPTDLEDHLTTLDEILLHHALACLMYPNGFEYSHACVADPSKCNHIEHALLNLNALAWYDAQAFSKRQKDMLSIRFNTNKLFDAEQLKEYREQFNCGKQRIIWFGDVGVSLEIPTIRQRKEAAQRWYDDVAEMINGAFNEPQTGPNRNAFMDAVTNATLARQYAHYVTGIYERCDEHGERLVSDKVSVIDGYLSQVLSESEVIEQFETEIRKYIADSMVGLVAIPSWNCPKCESPQGRNFHERFDHLIPLDIQTVFFTLSSQRVRM